MLFDVDNVLPVFLFEWLKTIYLRTYLEIYKIYKSITLIQLINAKGRNIVR